jgi:predicted PhzF superfamily epimerase YddE/YHI9
MQQVAAEMNLSETAFLYPLDQGYSLRWFTPETEVDLCGHATLASAHILWQNGHLAQDEEAIFQTKSGTLSATKSGEQITLDFPAKAEEACSVPPSLLDALGTNAVHVAKNIFDYVVQVDSPQTVCRLQPDFTLLAQVEARGVIVTAAVNKNAGHGAANKQYNPDHNHTEQSDLKQLNNEQNDTEAGKDTEKNTAKDSELRQYDIVSRFFAPAVGVNEDPVTGSAHCCLGPYWAKRLQCNELLAYQASTRGGVLRVTVNGERVYLAGQAQTILEGSLLV